MIKPKKSSSIGKIILHLIVALGAGIGALYISQNWLISFSTIIVTAILLQVYQLVRKKFQHSLEIQKIEQVFPDFLQLMASNLRAGMTIDKALLLSSRKEFAPLDQEILRLGKDMVTGKEIDKALLAMSERIGSEKIRKTITLIISGMRAGGNIAILLEETSHNMRERGFVEKRAASNVLMYVIFIFFAVAIGAPLLFGLSTVLVSVLTDILSTLPAMETSAQLPFALTKVNVSVEFITWFSLIFLVMTNILGSLVLGLVSKGEEKAGVRYVLILLVISISVFFIVKIFLGSYFADFFG